MKALESLCDQVPYCWNRVLAWNKIVPALVGLII
jgi:hypothetical protein